MEDNRFILVNFLGKSKNIRKIFKQDRINVSLLFTTIYTLTAHIPYYILNWINAVFNLQATYQLYCAHLIVLWLMCFGGFCGFIFVMWCLRLISFVQLAPWSACCLWPRIFTNEEFSATGAKNSRRRSCTSRRSPLRWIGTGNSRIL